jgi:tetratricopeptide (TPR) repeat protein
MRIVNLLLGICLAAPLAYPSQAQVAVYNNIRPGTANKAEVDLNLGEPLRKIAEQVYEYSPPRGVKDTRQVVVTYFSDTRQVSRVDVYLKVPIDPELVRPEFGTRVLVREREAGEQEEHYYPKLHALIFAGKSRGSPAIAISYISPRLLADFYVERFNELLRDKRYDDAVTEADKAVLVDPDYARGYLAQGAYWENQKNTDEAIVRYLAAGNAKYSSLSKATAHARLGTLYWRAKNWVDKAPVEFQRAISEAPSLDEAHLRYGEFLNAQKQWEQALTEFSTAVSLNPKNVQAHLDSADIYYVKGDYANALPHYTALSQWADTASADTRNDFKADIYFRYGFCLGQAKQNQPAIEAYLKALQRNPRLIQAYNNLGTEYQVAGNSEKANESFRNGLKIDSRNFSLNQNLANVLLESGRSEEARHQAEQTLRLKPDDATQKFNVARCWGALGKKKQALSWIQQAIAAGYKDRAKLTGDRFLALVQKDGDFKKLMQQIS